MIIKVHLNKRGEYYDDIDGIQKKKEIPKHWEKKKLAYCSKLSNICKELCGRFW